MNRLRNVCFYLVNKIKNRDLQSGLNVSLRLSFVTFILAMTKEKKITLCLPPGQACHMQQS